MADEKLYIYLHNWWSGFEDKSDANHIGFFEILFSATKLRNFEITTNLDKANILLEAGNPDSAMRNYKQWKYRINYIGEPILPEEKNYDLVLTSVATNNNIVDLPVLIMYIHCNNFLPFFLHPRTRVAPPELFCAFIVSNPKCTVRNRLFEKLNKYKKVNSMGQYNNNIGQIIHFPYWSKPYFDVLGKHKFMICCENTKMTTYSTEKIANPYIARTIPIYWGTHNIKNIFNPESMLFLEDETEESFDALIAKIIELDTDDEKYLEFINRPILNNHTIEYWNTNYTIEELGKKIDRVL